MKLERDKVYRAKDGGLWRVVCVDVPGSHQAIAVCVKPAAESSQDFGDPLHLHLDGRHVSVGSSHDLIAEHREPREWTLTRPGPHALWIEMQPGCDVGAETVRVREVLD
jgi:hypothetical protein